MGAASSAIVSDFAFRTYVRSYSVETVRIPRKSDGGDQESVGGTNFFHDHLETCFGVMLALASGGRIKLLNA